jgi:hypothetical protein
MNTRVHDATGEALLIPGRNPLRKVGHITRMGNWLKDERVADGFVVAMKEGNASGAKEPCCLWFL